MSAYNAAAWLVDRNVSEGRSDGVAYRVDGATTTYAELLQQVWRAQNALRALEVRAGERVALVVDDEAAFPAWFLGALRSGAVPVPLSTMLTAEDLAAIVADCGAQAVVVSARYQSHLPVLAGASPLLRQAVVLGDVDAEAGSADGSLAVHAWAGFGNTAEAPVAATDAGSPAVWLYSSGTTGAPKGVMHRHASLQATADTYARSVLGIGPDDRCLSVAKLFFAYGLGNSLTFPLSVGASAVLNPAPPTPAGVLSLILAERPTLFFTTPGFAAALLDADPPADALASVRCTVTAGEALPADLHRRFRERFGHPVLDGIGTTEALHIFLSNTVGDERPGTSGRPVPGYEARLLSDSGSEIAEPETPGYLQIRGPSLTAGYWNRPDATSAALQDGWLSTGDVYRRSAEGHWTFLGRNNDMMKPGGIWVSPAEVEAALVEHPDVLEAAVVGARDENDLESCVAFLVPRTGHEIDVPSISAHCRARLAAFKRPRRIIVVDTLPKTATGKVQRFALRAQLGA